MAKKKRKNKKTKNNLVDLTLTAVFMALGFVLPIITSYIPLVGNMLLPMHLPVFLCAFVCRKKYSIPMAIILPIARSLILSSPILFPRAFRMSFELLGYTLGVIFIYSLFRTKNLTSVYVSLISAMIIGRGFWALWNVIYYAFEGTGFTFAAFWSSGFVEAFPGLLLQLLIVPPLVRWIERIRR